MNTNRTSGNKRLLNLLMGAIAGGFCGAGTADEARLGIANAAVREGSSGYNALNFSVVRSGDSSSNIEIPYTARAGTARPGKDYVRLPPLTLRIPAGFMAATITIPVIGNTKIEPDETLQLVLGMPKAYNPMADFGAAGSYRFGASGPASVTAADFNADGLPDLATTNNGANAVSILLGTRGGGFGAASSFRVGTSPQSVIDADFNDDGRPDLAVTNGDSSSVSILLGTGNGGFGPATNFRTGKGPAALTSADFNRDGELDLAITNVGFGEGKTVSVLLGDGSGSFGTATTLVVAEFPEDIISADFNGDGNPDLAVASSRVVDGLSVLLGNGSGGFGAASNFNVAGFPNSLASGDFNEDEVPDLAVTNLFDRSVSILLGNGDGSFALPTNYIAGSRPGSVLTADFNGDGWRDLAVMLENSERVAVLIGNGSGGFGPARGFEIDTGPDSGMTSADINGDGKRDLVVATAGLDIGILLNSPSTTAVLSNSTAIGTIFNDD